MDTFIAAPGKAQRRLFLKLGIQRSSVISFCFSHSSTDVLLFLHAKERALCLDALNCTFEFYMSSVDDVKIVPIKRESSKQPPLFKQIRDEVKPGLTEIRSA